MSLPAGRWIVMVIGIVIIGFGCYTIYRHTIKAAFMERIGSLDDKKEKAV